MEVTIVSGKEMLTMCNCADRVKEIKQASFFTLIEHANQKLFIGGNGTEYTNTICIVEKNSDFTEGRGPMHFHKAFKSVEKAIDYIMTQDGIYGSRQGVSNHAGVDINGKPYCVSDFNGYDIKIVEVE